MNESVARAIAHRCHRGQRTRQGMPMADHVERVAAAVPRELRSLALLHDVLEHSPTTLDELARRGLTPLDRGALELLTRRSAERYEAHVRRIAQAGGPAGRAARTIKCADLDDHLALGARDGDPPYAWARAHVERARVRRGEATSVPAVALS